MKRGYWIGFGVACVLGTVAHFLYTWIPTPLIGLFVPVNESVWEHLKLLFWPTIVTAACMSQDTREPQRLWGGVLTAVLVAPGGMLGIYYLLAAGFGLKGLALDLLLYYGTMAGEFWLIARLERSGRVERWTGILVIIAGLYAISLTAFTVAPPALPIFTPGA